MTPDNTDVQRLTKFGRASMNDGVWEKITFKNELRIYKYRQTPVKKKKVFFFVPWSSVSERV